MKIENYQFPKSSFLSVEKDLNLIVSMMLKNDRLQKLLYYTTPDALQRPNLTEEQKLSLFGRKGNIRILPRIEIVPEINNFIVISFDTFAPNGVNPQFRDNTIVFTIVCHQDNWHLKDFELRPYKIAAELDTMFNEKHLTGIGDLEFVGGTYIPVNEDYAGFSMCFLAIHGGEDKYKMPNPADEAAFIKDFNKMYNNDEE